MAFCDDIEKILLDKTLPQHDELLTLVESCVSLLEDEDEKIRPKMSTERKNKKISGGLLDFRSVQQGRPVIVVPDLHARTYFLRDILNKKIFVGEQKTELSVLQCLEQELIYVVCVGDLFHSELRCYDRWKNAFLEYRKGNILSDAMKEEMVENLRLLEMVIKTKLAFPSSFHFLKGNHENILNEEGRGNHSFYKMAREGSMVYDFMQEFYGDALLYIISCFEHALPICAVFNNLVVSHAEPYFTVGKTKIINYKKNPDVVLALTWTSNDSAERGSVSKSIRNLVGKNCREVTWIGGHRPVRGKFALRQRGKYVQIHNPDEENVAFVESGRKFNPESDIISVGGN